MSENQSENQGPVSEHPDPDETTDTNAGEDAVQGTVADQPDDPEEAK
jgi:hypothetical protein